jgi:hypothetical protein
MNPPVSIKVDDHAQVQSVTAVNWLCTEQVAVNPLHTVELGVSEDQTVVQCKRPLRPVDSVNSCVSSTTLT